jgi:hypothetical protein
VPHGASIAWLPGPGPAAGAVSSVGAWSGRLAGCGAGFAAVVDAPPNSCMQQPAGARASVVGSTITVSARRC